MRKRLQVQGAVAKHLSEVAKQLAAFLEKVLPPLFDDWWDKAIVNNLSYQQKRRLEQRNIASLGGLDLAGLLLVLDQNWYQISASLDLTSETRHFVKEMQTVRNRWAHADTIGFPTDDIYRDLDTLERFSIVIGADDKLIHGLRETKTSLLNLEPNPNPSDTAGIAKVQENLDSDAAEFEPGQIVYVKSNPSSRGAVLTVIHGKPENRFKVFLEGSSQTFYSSQLQAEDPARGKGRFLTLRPISFLSHRPPDQISGAINPLLAQRRSCRFHPVSVPTRIAFYPV